MPESFETPGDPLTLGGSLDQDACHTSSTENRLEPCALGADPLLNQLASAGEDADLALILVHVDANMLHGWPPPFAAWTALRTVGHHCATTMGGASRFIPSIHPPSVYSTKLRKVPVVSEFLCLCVLLEDRKVSRLRLIQATGRPARRRG